MCVPCHSDRVQDKVQISCPSYSSLAWGSFSSSCAWIRAEGRQKRDVRQTTLVLTKCIIVFINCSMVTTNIINLYNASKRVARWLRRHDLSSVTAAPLLSHQPYCAAAGQQEYPGWCVPLSFLPGNWIFARGKKRMASIVVCLLEWSCACMLLMVGFCLYVCHLHSAA